MMRYTIHKGVNAPLEFRGLKAQYISWLAVGLTALLVLFSGLYTLGAGTYLSLAVTAALGAALFRGIYHLSARFGPHGLARRIARRRLPEAVVVRSRALFMKKIAPHEKDD
jgi:hypothetical protein